MGDLQTYLQEVRRLKPDDAQPEVLSYAMWMSCGVANQVNAGSILYQSPSVRVAPGYEFVVEQIRGGCPVPPQMQDDASTARLWTIAEFLPYIGFNVINEGRQKPVFKLPLAMNMFVNSCGSTDGLKFKVPITFFEGADVSVQWFADLVAIKQMYAPFGANNRRINPGNLMGNDPHIEFYVYLIGTIIRAEIIG